jgi:hypothetical protein
VLWDEHLKSVKCSIAKWHAECLDAIHDANGAMGIGSPPNGNTLYIDSGVLEER